MPTCAHCLPMSLSVMTPSFMLSNGSSNKECTQYPGMCINTVGDETISFIFNRYLKIPSESGEIAVSFSLKEG